MNSDSVGYERQRNQDLANLEKTRKEEIAKLTNSAKAEESQLKSAMESQVSGIENQLVNINGSINQIQSALEDPNLPAGEKQKLRKRLEQLRAHKVFLQTQIFRMKVRVQSRLKLLWFHIRTNKDLINERMDNQRSLLLRRYAEIMTRLTNQGLIERAQARAQQQQARQAAGRQDQPRQPSKPSGLSFERRGESQSVAG